MGRKKNQEEETEGNDEVNCKLNTIIAKMEKLEKSINKIDEIEISVNFISDEFENLRKEIAEIKADIVNNRKENQELNRIIKIQKEELADLKQNMEYLLARDKAQNAEVKGVPRKEGENLKMITMEMARKAGIGLKEEDIQDIYRIKIKVSNMPLFMINFKLQKTKEDFVKACRKARLKLEDVGLGAKEPIFVNEDLTWNARKIFTAALVYKRKEGIQFCWTKGGKVFLRRSDTSKIKWIKDLDDLKEI